MAADYRDFQPMLLDTISLELLTSPRYEQFIHAATTEPGARLIVHRDGLRTDWPYVDTKFNPNTGQDLPPAAYDVVYLWFFGRGSEALAGHLPWLDATAMSQADRDRTREVFSRLVKTMTDGINQARSANRGRCPFRVNRQLQAIDDQGRPMQAPTEIRSAGDLFCAKGMIASGESSKASTGVDMLLDIGPHYLRNAYGSDQGVDIVGKVGQGSKMLMQATAALVVKAPVDTARRHQALDQVAEAMRMVLDKHWDADRGVFAEYLDARTGQPLSDLDPGHASEFVGLGLGAVEAMESQPDWLDDDKRALLSRAKEQMPRILLSCCQAGWNHAQHGLHKLVDPATGKVLNDDMPWWNLPETMRSVVRAVAVCRDEQTRGRLLEWFRLAHNAYFGHFLNRDKMLFPYQTRSGATGEVVNKVPAVPEGDPLYHTNLSLLDMLDVLRRMR